MGTLEGIWDLTANLSPPPHTIEEASKVQRSGSHKVTGNQWPSWDQNQVSCSLCPFLFPSLSGTWSWPRANYDSHGQPLLACSPRHVRCLLCLTSFSLQVISKSLPWAITTFTCSAMAPDVVISLGFLWSSGEKFPWRSSRFRAVNLLSHELCCTPGSGFHNHRAHLSTKVRLSRGLRTKGAHGLADPF